MTFVFELMNLTIQMLLAALCAQIVIRIAGINIKNVSIFVTCLISFVVIQLIPFKVPLPGYSFVFTQSLGGGTGDIWFGVVQVLVFVFTFRHRIKMATDPEVTEPEVPEPEETIAEDEHGPITGGIHG